MTSSDLKLLKKIDRILDDYTVFDDPKLTLPLFKAAKAQPARFVRLWAKWADTLCPNGFIKVLSSKAKSWRDYAKAHWDDEDFRDWAEDEIVPAIKTPAHNCKECGMAVSERNVWPLRTAFREGLTFDEFEKKFPKVKWVKWI